jgi:hypothetical protein
VGGRSARQVTYPLRLRRLGACGHA